MTIKVSKKNRKYNSKKNRKYNSIKNRKYNTRKNRKYNTRNRRNKNQNYSYKRSRKAYTKQKKNFIISKKINKHLLKGGTLMPTASRPQIDFELDEKIQCYDLGGLSDIIFNKHTPKKTKGKLFKLYNDENETQFPRDELNKFYKDSYTKPEIGRLIANIKKRFDFLNNPELWNKIIPKNPINLGVARLTIEEEVIYVRIKEKTQLPADFAKGQTKDSYINFYIGQEHGNRSINKANLKDIANTIALLNNLTGVPKVVETEDYVDVVTWDADPEHNEHRFGWGTSNEPDPEDDLFRIADLKDDNGKYKEEAIKNIFNENSIGSPEINEHTLEVTFPKIFKVTKKIVDKIVFFMPSRIEDVRVDWSLRKRHGTLAQYKRYEAISYGFADAGYKTFIGKNYRNFILDNIKKNEQLISVYSAADKAKKIAIDLGKPLLPWEPGHQPVPQFELAQDRAAKTPSPKETAYDKKVALYRLFHIGNLHKRNNKKMNEIKKKEIIKQKQTQDFYLTIRRICTIIFDIILALSLEEALEDLTPRNPILTEENVLSSIFNYKDVRSKKISDLVKDLNHPKKNASGNVNISLLQEVSKDYEHFLLEKRHMWGSKDTLLIEKEGESNDINTNKFKKGSASCIYVNKSFIDKSNVKQIGVGKADCICAQIKLKLAGKIIKILLVSIHTTTDGSTAVKELEIINKHFETLNDVNYLIIGMDTNCKTEALANNLFNFCKRDDVNINIAGFDLNPGQEDPGNTIVLEKWNKSQPTAGGVRTLLQTQFHKANEQEAFHIDFIFYKTKAAEDKMVCINKDYRHLKPLSPSNMSDHQPVGCTFTIGDYHTNINILSFNLAGPNTSLLEYKSEPGNTNANEPDIYNLIQTQLVPKMEEKVLSYMNKEELCKDFLGNMLNKYSSDELKANSITPDEYYNKIVKILTGNNSTTQDAITKFFDIKLKELFSKALSYNYRLFSMFDKYPRGSLTKPKNKLSSLMKFINIYYLESLLEAKGDNYPTDKLSESIYEKISDQRLTDIIVKETNPVKILSSETKVISLLDLEQVPYEIKDDKFKVKPVLMSLGIKQKQK